MMNNPTTVRYSFKEKAQLQKLAWHARISQSAFLRKLLECAWQEKGAEVQAAWEHVYGTAYEQHTDAIARRLKGDG